MLPGKNPQVQNSAGLQLYFPAVGPEEGMNSGYCDNVPCLKSVKCHPVESPRLGAPCKGGDRNLTSRSR